MEIEAPSEIYVNWLFIRYFIVISDYSKDLMNNSDL